MTFLSKNTLTLFITFIMALVLASFEINILEFYFTLLFYYFSIFRSNATPHLFLEVFVS